MAKNITISDNSLNFRFFDKPFKFDATSIQRVEKLICEALNRAKIRSDYCIFGKWHGDYAGYAIQFYESDGLCIVSGIDRGELYPSSIFSFNDLHQAAEYFVWKVSDGSVEINWELFL